MANGILTEVGNTKCCTPFPKISTKVEFSFESPTNVANGGAFFQTVT